MIKLLKNSKIGHPPLKNNKIKGIGREIAKSLALNGAIVYALDINEKLLNELKDEVILKIQIFYKRTPK